MNDIDDAYSEFRDDILRRALESADPQESVFFEQYSGLAAENGDCADLT